MHFPAWIYVIFALSLRAFAEVHNSMHCVSVGKTPATWEPNNFATGEACAAYRRKPTGKKQWDSCPDCATVSVTAQPACDRGTDVRPSNSWGTSMFANRKIVTC
ncbi:hypothetical protein K3495_g6334 [Podosphaera aphanis]|nr:hypothetical protein K3495_g6334 [Podosphaera aphanis]